MNVETTRQPTPTLHQETAYQYEAARRQLARALTEYSADLGTPGAPQELGRRRNEIIETGMAFFGPLRRFVQHEVRRWADMDGFDITDVPVDDVVAAIYLQAVDQAAEAPQARAFYTWLRRIARREVRAALLEQERLNRLEVSLQQPVQTVGEWPDRALRLIAVLADPTALPPDEIIIGDDEAAVLDRLLGKLPERWREIFLLRVIDGWDVEEVATAEGIAAENVRAIVRHSRAFLGAWLLENADVIA